MTISRASGWATHLVGSSKRTAGKKTGERCPPVSKHQLGNAPQNPPDGTAPEPNANAAGA